MKLIFPNPSRSFDEHLNRVEFWGYESSMQIRFFIQIDALKKLDPEMGSTEADYLKTFDAQRAKILKVAQKVYSHNKFDSYDCLLEAQDF